VYVEVAHEGTDVRERARQRVFEPFFTTRELEDAAGLGVGLACETARRHGGEIGLGGDACPSMSVRLPARFRSAR
jgi:C4-dicarboxylate-specific signal transduction histidine kinase